jgi:hypothetical protein
MENNIEVQSVINSRDQFIKSHHPIILPNCDVVSSSFSNNSFQCTSFFPPAQPISSHISASATPLIDSIDVHEILQSSWKCRIFDPERNTFSNCRLIYNLHIECNIKRFLFLLCIVGSSILQQISWIYVLHE